jgi:branched-chain amino acid transport system permease protein
MSSPGDIVGVVASESASASASAAAAATRRSDDGRPVIDSSIGVGTGTGATAVAVSVVARLADGRWRVAEIVFWLAIVAAFFALPDYLALGSQILLTGLFALSLDLVLGKAGILSLGHAAFFGVGAYTAGLLAAHGHGEPVSGLAAAAAASALIGWLASFLVLRGGALARLMITMGIAALLHEIANQNSWLTGGVDGLQGIEISPLLGRFAFDIAGRTAYVYCLVVTFALFWLVRRITYSPMGLSLVALRENGVRMSALGVNVKRRLTLFFVIGAAIAGVAGALLAQTTQFVALDALGVQRSADVLVMLVIGGVGRLYGGLVGAAGFMIAQHFLSNINPVYWQFYMGLLLIGLVLVGKGGLLGMLGRLGRRGREAGR